ncbi:hypothetical protein DJ82_13845 [Halorubrum sp. Ib24]|uniref:restriction endonuclease n=1 Tax=Halorubrum sp. Ib24 TaxID=1383850 RepID=UPI000B989740|nr:restriction endonuclease [Halorubrum sp. Ib24]OYR38018.1 hypothetical protein DJ82_13845 [Halorubrum sp. Ib24]
MPENILEFRNFLEEISNLDIEVAQEFEVTVPHRLMAFLGHNPAENMFFDVTYGDIHNQKRPDSAIAESPEQRPWIINEVAYFDVDLDQSTFQERFRNRITPILREYHEIADPEYTLFISNIILAVLHNDTMEEFFLEDISVEEARRIYELLSVPENYPLEELPSWDEQRPERISTPDFSLDLRRYNHVLELIYEAETNEEKKESLEDLAEILFNSIPYLKIRERNDELLTGELDLVVEYTNSDRFTIFDQFDRFILVECKNWTSSVGVDEIESVEASMKKSKVDLGVIFARNGISGGSGQKFAQREILDVYQREDIIIVVINGNDLEQILAGESFYDIIDEKIYRIRFPSL